MKIAYFGTPGFSARFLERLLTDKALPIEVVLVVTQPDKAVGRRQQVEESPVKRIAQKYSLPVFDNWRVSNPEGVPQNAQDTSILWDEGEKGPASFQALLDETDLALVYAYGHIIPADILTLPKGGFWNIHPSLLPSFRGPSPTAYPLLLGEQITGVTLMQMDAQMDHGPIIDQEKFQIPHDMRRPELEEKLTDVGYELFGKVILTLSLSKGRNLAAHKTAFGDFSSSSWRTQNEVKATYTRLLKKQNGFIPLTTIKKALKNEPLHQDELPSLILDYMKRNSLEQLAQLSVHRSLDVGGDIRNSSRIIFNYYRGLHPWPGIWTLLRPSVPEAPARKKQDFGEQTSKRLKITDMSLVAGKLTINRVQLEGKNEVDFTTFQNAYSLF